MLYAVRRPADGTFAGRRFQVLERFTHEEQRFVQELAVAADDSGRTTRRVEPGETSAGPRFTAGIRFAVGRGGGADVRPPPATSCPRTRRSTARGRRSPRPPAAPPSAGPARDRKTYTFQTALINRYKIYRPDDRRHRPARSRATTAPKPLTLATLDAAGNTTLILTRPDPLQPRTPTTEHVLTTTGR